MADAPMVALELVNWIDLEVMRREHAKPVTDTVPTSLPTWNAACRGEGGGLGLAKGWQVVVAGKPGAGKSALALNVTLAAMRDKRSVMFYSLEMSRAQLVTRFIGIATGCDLRRIERGAQFDAGTFESAMYAIRDAGLLGRLTLCDRPPRSMAGLTVALRQAADEGCSLAVVDYVQLIGRAEYPGMFERTQAVSGRLQELAFETGLTVLALSQMNRGALTQKTEEPGIEALKGGSLDEDADQVLLLDFSNFNRTPTGATTNLLVAKNRHGPQPKIPVAWDYRTLRVQEVPERDRYATSPLGEGPRP